MTEQNKTPLTAQPGSAPAPEQKPAEKRPAEKPLRRVGSLTLGACLIAAGVFFLLYFFVRGALLCRPPRPLEVRFCVRAGLSGADGGLLLHGDTARDV